MCVLQPENSFGTPLLIIATSIITNIFYLGMAVILILSATLDIATWNFYLVAYFFIDF